MKNLLLSLTFLAISSPSWGLGVTAGQTTTVKLANGSVTTPKLHVEALMDSNKDADVSSLTVADIILGNGSSDHTYGPNTADASDDSRVQFAGGGALSNTRGARLELGGNESATTGSIRLHAGNISGGTVNMYTGSDALRMTVDESGNVGIGTASPGSKLEVADATAGTTLESTLSHTETANAASDAQFVIQTGGLSGGDPILKFRVAGANIFHMGIDNSIANDTFMFSTSQDLSSPAMAIEQAGNVGIGNASPGYDLTVSDSNSASQAMISTYDDGNTFSELRMLKSDTDTVGTYSTTDATDVLGRVNFQNVNGSNAIRTGATITSTQTSGCGAGVCASNLVLETQSTSGTNTNQMVLSADGNVGIGTASPGFTLDVAGQIGGSGVAGEYTAVASTQTNLQNTASALANSWRWTRLGNIVTVSGHVNLDGTSSGSLAEALISLPITSNLSSGIDATGSCTAYTVGNDSIRVIGEPTTDTALLSWYPTDTVNNGYSCLFMYEVK